MNISRFITLIVCVSLCVSSSLRPYSFLSSTTSYVGVPFGQKELSVMLASIMPAPCFRITPCCNSCPLIFFNNPSNDFLCVNSLRNQLSTLWSGTSSSIHKSQKRITYAVYHHWEEFGVF